MDFAKDILGKYGWREGSGLGKNNDGIIKPVKAKYKFDNSGFGHNKIDEINPRWWEDAYRPANLPAKISNTEKDSIENAKYKGSFLKTSTLINSIETNEKPNDANLIENIPTAIIIPTDADLYRACGGRTAHKGARHGLTLKGKLARIEAQEQDLLKKMNETYAPKWIENKLAIKKIEKEKILKEELDDKTYENIRDPETENLNKILNLNDYRTTHRSFNETKKRKRIDDELSEALAIFSTDENEKKIKPKTKNKEKINDRSSSSVAETVTSIEKHKRHKKSSSSSITKESSLQINKIDKNIKIKQEPKEKEDKIKRNSSSISHTVKIKQEPKEDKIEKNYSSSSATVVLNTKEIKQKRKEVKKQLSIWKKLESLDAHDRGTTINVETVDSVAKLFKEKKNKSKKKKKSKNDEKYSDNLLKLEKTIAKEKKKNKPHKSKRDSSVVNKLVTKLENNMVIK